MKKISPNKTLVNEFLIPIAIFDYVKRGEITISDADAYISMICISAPEPFFSGSAQTLVNAVPRSNSLKKTRASLRRLVRAGLIVRLPDGYGLRLWGCYE